MRVDGQLVNAGTEVVSTLPVSNLFYGRKVLLSTDDTMYQYVGTWEAVGSGGAATFTELTDTPASYAGQQFKTLFVNQTEDGIFFGDINFPDLLDTPADYNLAGGQLLAVRSDELGIEYIDNFDRFTLLADTPNAYSGQADKIVAVNSGETALEFIDAPTGGSSTFTALTDTPADYTGQGDRFVRVKTDESGLEFITGTGGGVATFTDLSDTPNAYSGEANKVVQVKADESGLEFVAGGGGGATNFTDLADTPSDYIGQADNILAVTVAEDGVEFIPLPTGGGGVIPATEAGQMIRSTGILDDEYEWMSSDICRWYQFNMDEYFNIGSIDESVNTYFTGRMDVEGVISQFLGDCIFEGIDTFNADISTLSIGQDFLTTDSFGLFDVINDIAVFQVDINAFGVIDALGGFSSGGVPLGVIIEDQIHTKYEDKFIEELTLNPAANQTNILTSFTDLTPGAWYKVDASALLKFKANDTGVDPKVSYDVSIKGTAATLRKVSFAQGLALGGIEIQPWRFSFSFQATEPQINFVVKTALDEENIYEAKAFGLSMTVEQFNPHVRRETNEW